MAVNAKTLILSGSTNGRPIKVTGTNSGAANTVHTVSTGTYHAEHIVLSAVNRHTASVTLTLQAGGTTSPDDEITITLPPAGEAYQDGAIPILRSGELVLSDVGAAGVAVKAFASVANVVSLMGHVTQITNQ